MKKIVLPIFWLLCCCLQQTFSQQGPKTWRTCWISAPKTDITIYNYYFSKTISFGRSIQSATLTITALGLYEASLNSQKISPAYFSPGWTNYTQNLQYQTYNVQKLIKPGKNILTITLAPGWYSGGFGGDKSPNHYGKQNAFAAKLFIQYKNGKTQTITSDSTWTVTPSYIRQSDFYDGETQDTRITRTQQNTTKALQIPNPNITLIPSIAPPVTAHEIFRVLKHWKDAPNRHVLDFGQNLAGFVRLKIKGRAGDTLKIQHAEMLDENHNFYTGNLRLAKAADTYILNGKTQTLEPHFTYHGFRYARITINPNLAQKRDKTSITHNALKGKPGQYTTANRNTKISSNVNHNLTAQATHNALKGKHGQYRTANKNTKTSSSAIHHLTAPKTPNTFKATTSPYKTADKKQPQFSVHTKDKPLNNHILNKTNPYKNASTISLDPNTTLYLNQTHSVALYTDLQPTGTFTCSNPKINSLQNNILWSMKSNFIDIPTDCPQRSERYGWTGDAQVFFTTAAYNYNTKTFYQKYLNSIRQDQGANGGMPNIIPDFRSPQKTTKGGTAGWGDAAVLIPWRHYQFYGDKNILRAQYPSMKAWVDYITARAKNNLWTDDGYGDWYAQGDSTSLHLIDQAYYAHSCKLLAKTAKVLGHSSDAKHYIALAAVLREKFNAVYGRFDTRATRTQTAYLLALEFDLLPEDQRQGVADSLAKNIISGGRKLATGFLGTPFLLPVLGRYGYGSLAYDLLLNEHMPSWLYPISKGATTIWEKWDAVEENGKLKDCSFNHFAYGAVGEWFYNGLAGIKATSPGFKTIQIAPVIDRRLKWVEVKFKSPNGLVGVKWKIVGSKVYLDLEMPKGTIGELKLPDGIIAKQTNIKLSKGKSQFRFALR